jgi:phage tail-like protein
MSTNPEENVVEEEASPDATWVDPYRAYNFRLKIGGSSAGYFTECTGMGIKVEAIEHCEGGSNVVHRLPGPVRYGDITLKYGLTDSRELWQWFKSAVNGKVERKNVTIALVDADGVAEVMTWDLINAWPSEWRGAPLDAKGREIAIETITLVYESLDRPET